MALERLQNECRDYFDRAQHSWDEYFSKWESMAKEEKIDDEDVAEFDDSEVKGKIIPQSRKIRKIALGKLNKRRVRVRSNGKAAKLRKKKVHSKISDRKRGETEIIHTTENQTNLQCEVVNNKHFEADLKAIFIEIMSENTNKMGMFSVLSRMFSGNGDTISNFSLGSMTVEKNEFSISPVSKTILHCARDNEFLNWNFPSCRPNGSGREGVGAGFRDSRVSDTTASEALRDETTLWGEGPQTRFGSLSNQSGAAGTLGRCIQTRMNCKAIAYCEGEANDQGSGNKPTSGLNSRSPEKAAASSGNGLSPQATLRRIMQSPAPVTPSNDRIRRCFSENRPRSKRRKTHHRRLADSDEDSDDQSQVPARTLKIFCTPTRPKRCVKNEELESRSRDSDQENCFNIFDRD